MELGRVAESLLPKSSDMVLEKTFASDELLPDLPLPSLSETLKRYLDSVKPHVTEQEFVDTKEIVNQFEKNEGSVLHQRLVDRAKGHRNWLDDWWLKYGYLSNNESLVPGTNFGGAWLPPDHPLKKLILGDLDHSRWRARTLATFLHHELRFWCKLRQENVPQNKDGKGNPFTMHQMRYLFNGARTPGTGPGGIDEIKNYFKTENEGECPNHIVVLHQGRFFKVIPFDESTGEPWDINKIEQVILQIENIAEMRGPNTTNSLGVLTTLDRKTWAEVRSSIISISDGNRNNFKEVESAILAIVLDDSEPLTESELLKTALSGSNGNSDIYADKSWSRIATKNGLFVSQSEHSAYDGMATMDGCAFALMEISKQKPPSLANLPSPPIVCAEKWLENNKDCAMELKFELNLGIQKHICDAKENISQKMKNLYLELKSFDNYGKTRMKETKVHPDTFMQVAIQISGFKTKGRALPTYETATTRHFYHGRTETVRSCTDEAITLAKAMVEKDKHSEKDLIQMFEAAVGKHNSLMKLGMENAGCDRHLFGLSILAQEDPEFKTLPNIFTDPSFKKSGGGGNFTLSTSLCGYTSITGCCPPMVADGYGVFYAILQNKVLVWIATYEDSNESNPELFWENLTKTLDEINELFKTTNQTSSPM